MDGGVVLHYSSDRVADKYLVAELVQRALAPARAASLNAFGGLCMKCSICGKDDAATNVCSTVVAYRVTNRDLNAVEMDAMDFLDIIVLLCSSTSNIRINTTH